MSVRTSCPNRGTGSLKKLIAKSDNPNFLLESKQSQLCEKFSYRLNAKAAPCM